MFQANAIYVTCRYILSRISVNMTVSGYWALGILTQGVLVKLIIIENTIT